MKFKLDENLPDLVRELISQSGHDAHSAAEERLAGASDDALFQACIAEDRILITLDLDFADIRSYPPGTHPGIWVLRPAKQTFRRISELVKAGIRLTNVESVRGQLWIVDENRVRIRDRPT